MAFYQVEPINFQKEINMNYRHVDTTQDIVLFANPSNIDDTLRIKCVRGTKNVGPHRVTNIRSEVKTLSPVDVTIDGAVVGSEPVSVTTSISGSRANAQLVAAKVRAHIANLQIVLNDLTEGWKPDANAALVVTPETE